MVRAYPHALAPVGALICAVIFAITLGAGPGAAASVAPTSNAVSAADASSAVYIVRMIDAPTVAYDGGISGLRATRPAKGKKLDPNSPEVTRYAAYLDAQHDAKVAKAGGTKIYSYRYSFNGFAARMSEAQARRISSDSDVLAIERAVEVTMDTATTPAFLGLTDPVNGLWAKAGGVGSAGEDVIVGIIDTGIWPESLSFSDRTGTNPNDKEGKLGYQQIPGWHGKCVPGEAFTASDCNQKLIGAQYFNAARGGNAAILPHEFTSARDYNGHGTHTAGTAAGNHAVPTTGAASGFGQVSGIAPRARVAAYKVCWDNGAGSCGANSADSVAAIDQAVIDGVDVLNYSISGTSTNYFDAVEVAYLFAAEAGVFVATSAGNSGPTVSSVAHISPWLASVAAGTHNRSGSATVTLGNAAVYTGASLTPGVGPASVVSSVAVKKLTATTADAGRCFLGTLDPALTAGKIVHCDRGVNARVEKSQEVGSAGGIGMILTNTSANSLNADLHSIPTVHLSHLDRPAIIAYIATAGATAKLSTAVINGNVPAPDIAAFSSRGPSLAGGGDIMKPDFVAPGQDILAAVAPPGYNGKDFDLLSGTSMSSPHVAGLAALLIQAHPDWSPAAIRSSLATTAGPIIGSAENNSPFNIGSGHVRPNLARNPGLVYDAGFTDYLAFLAGQGCGNCGAPIDASDLNQPSISIGDLAGSQTVTRTVKNVGGASATYIATVAAPTGYTVSVAPSSFTIAAGGTRTFTTTITRTTADLGTFAFGSLTWSDGTHVARSPIAVRSVAIAAPARVSGANASGTTSYSIKTGYAGTLSYAKRGLVAAAEFAGSVLDDPTDNFNAATPSSNQGFTTHDVVVPAGTTYARFSLFDADTDGADDLDLYVYRVSGTTLIQVGASGGGTSAEEVNLTSPTAATYRVYVHGWETDGPSANYTLFAWTVPSTDSGNLTVSDNPSGPATIGGTRTVTLTWAGLGAGLKYLGMVDYSDGATTIGTTQVRVDVP